MPADAFDDFLAEHGRLDIYDTGEKSQRRKAFEDTSKRIYDHNQLVGQSFRLGLNQMADWLAHEVQLMFPPPLLINRTALTQQHHSNWPNANIPSEINWAGDLNPLYQSVVPAVKNQGMCGSCWAFTTIASTEASIHLTRGEAPPPLSVQELIDCDTEYNRGCYGGNPVLAYDYVMNKGVASWADYPYIEQRGKCRRSFVEPSAKIDGFLMIASFDQKSLKKFVATAPVSIGICGTDFAFMFYAGGVFDYADCCSLQNHAMLIVGYGTDDATGLDYWLLQNSWGTKWGEDGFMRILRSDDLGLGLCGLASNPTMAMGGRILSSSNATAPGAVQDVFARTNLWLDQHWMVLMVVFAVALLVASGTLFLQALSKTRRSVRARQTAHPHENYGAINSI